MSYTVKDSGARQEFEGGMRRDSEQGKPDFTLLPRDFLTRFAAHLTLGMEKYGEDNWRLACDEAAVARFRRSAHRHFFQWLDDEQDEDHASAVAFNLAACEYAKAVLRGDPEALRILKKARFKWLCDMTHPGEPCPAMEA